MLYTERIDFKYIGTFYDVFKCIGAFFRYFHYKVSKNILFCNYLKL